MSHDALEKRLASISDEITTIQSQLSSLNERFSAIENFQQKILTTTVDGSSDEEEQTSAIPDIGSSQILDKVAQTSLLPRIATLCFLLVFALILRTLTDNNMLNTQVGSVVGVCYASGLIMWGVRLLKKGSKLASVFKISGVVLLYMILLETHTRFESFSSFFVYTLLAAVLLSVSWISVTQKLIGFSILGIFGTVVVASVIDFPTPHFGQLHLLLLTANILAFLAAKKIGKGEWNRLLVFALTVAMSILWILRLQAELNLNAIVPAFVSLSWFIPMAALFILAYTSMFFFQVISKTKFSILDLFLPAMAVIWLFPLLSAGLEAQSVSPLFIGIGGVAWGVLYLGFGAPRLIKKPEGFIPALNSIVIAGCILLFVALPKITGDILPSIAIWSVIGLMIAKAGCKYDLGGMRFFSYLFQFIVCLMAIISGQFTPSTESPLAAVTIAGLLTAITAFQFHMFRHSTPSPVGFFKHVDRSDRSCLLNMITAMISCFMMLQILGYQALKFISSTPGQDLPGIQSFILNIGAIILFFYAKKTKKKEFLSLAVVLAIINGFKVFLYDMFNTGSGPLVLSVLSFGAVAATASLILSKWSPTTPAEAPRSSKSTD